MIEVISSSKFFLIRKSWEDSAPSHRTQPIIGYFDWPAESFADGNVVKLPVPMVVKLPSNFTRTLAVGGIHFCQLNPSPNCLMRLPSESRANTEIFEFSLQIMQTRMGICKDATCSAFGVLSASFVRNDLGFKELPKQYNLFLAWIKIFP